MPQLRLLMFGGLTLLTGEERVTGAATRRHRLALLALLAMSRNRGLERDKIHAFLWPDGDTRRVRHRLNQLLYFQRRHLDDGGLFLGRKTLRLNPAVITTEAWDFEAALDAGDYETAVRIYVGPFLDGFFLSHSPVFERWAEDQRRRLEKRCAEAITALAKGEALRGRPSQALAWWRRAAELDPFNTQTVRHLVEASLAVGDRVAALRDAQHHADLLRTELQLAADPGLTRLLAHLRDGSDTG